MAFLDFYNLARDVYSKGRIDGFEEYRIKLLERVRQIKNDS